MAGIDSFVTGSGFTITNPSFKPNRETIAKNMISAGVRSAVNDRIIIDETPGASNLILLEQLKYLAQENTGRLNIGDINPEVTGSVISPFRSVQQKDYNNLRDGDTRYLEVAFSPQNQINDDIVNQIGYINIGDYIGDVRRIYDDTSTYKDLDTLRDEYFTKYTKSYDLRDFVRLIKFFDNSLFKMIKDFTPSNVTLTSGVVVKQHILERSRHRATKVNTQIDSQLSGSIPVGTFSGGTGGVLQRYQDNPTQFNLTQSWDEVVQTVFGPTTIKHTDESEFYNGEYTSPIDVNVQGADCKRFINPQYEEVEYKPVFVTTTDFSEDEFLRLETQPNTGIVWFWWEGNQVKHIKVSNTSRNGTDITNRINQESTFSIFLNRPSEQTAPPYTVFLPSGVYVWPITDRKVNDNYTYLKNDPNGSPYVVYSEDIETINFNLNVTGDYIWQARNEQESIGLTNPVLNIGITSSIPQGYFPATTTYPREQFFRGWDNARYLLDYQVYSSSNATYFDPANNFDEGPVETSTANNTNFRQVYGPSTEPWFMNASASFETQNAFVDLNPSPRSAKLVVGLQLTVTANCNTLNNNNTGGPIIAIDYERHQDLFVRNGSGNLVLRQDANGSEILDDLILYNPNGTSVQWHPDSLITTGVASTNPVIGGYGVNRLFTTSNDRIIINIGTLNGRPGVTSIFYCPTP
jgi:hypothetical protein